MKKILIVTLFAFTFISNLSGQNSLSARLLTLSTHPFADLNLPLHLNPVDNDGFVTLEPGLIVSYDRFLYKKFSVRISSAIFNDRFNLLSGYSQIMIKYKIFKFYKHSLYAGFGPAVHYGTDKSDLEGYVNEDNFIFTDELMYKISWISGLIEYNYMINKKLDLAVAFNHINPKSLALSIGVRFDIPDPGGKGCNCPGYR